MMQVIQSDKIWMTKTFAGGMAKQNQIAPAPVQDPYPSPATDKSRQTAVIFVHGRDCPRVPLPHATFTSLPYCYRSRGNDALRLMSERSQGRLVIIQHDITESRSVTRRLVLCGAPISKHNKSLQSLLDEIRTFHENDEITEIIVIGWLYGGGIVLEAAKDFPSNKVKYETYGSIHIEPLPENIPIIHYMYENDMSLSLCNAIKSSKDRETLLQRKQLQYLSPENQQPSKIPPIAPVHASMPNRVLNGLRDKEGWKVHGKYWGMILQRIEFLVPQSKVKN